MNLLMPFFTFNLNTLLGWITTHFLFDVILGLLSQATYKLTLGFCASHSS